ncbi:MAG: hypothetical protein ACFFDC_01420 [Promethearchaeota archaeon]
MTQDSDNSDEVDLQLAQRIIELTKVVEENKEMLKKLATDLEKRNSTIENCATQLQDWDVKLGTNVEDINKQINSLEEKIELQVQNLDNKLEEVSNSYNKLEEDINNQNQKISSRFGELEEKFESRNQHAENKYEEFSTQFIEIQETQNNHDQTISSFNNTLEEHKTEIQDRLRVEQFKTTFEETINELNDKISSLNQNQEKLQLEIENYVEKTQEQFGSLAKTIELVGDGLSQLEQLNKNHALLIEEQRNSLSQFKHKLKELISLSKEDQKTHFENFSRIIESYNENIRTELTIATQSLKESDTQILDEVSASFMPKKVGKELQKTIADLSNELKMEAQKTRDDLIQGLQENVQEYEKTMEEQNTSIKNYQKQLEQFQDEILAIIDRKVNEKYEVIFSLLSKVALQAEELTLLIKASEIQISSPPPQKSHTPAGSSKVDQEEEGIISEIPIAEEEE